jgi:hypothetical protein
LRLQLLAAYALLACNSFFMLYHRIAGFDRTNAYLEKKIEQENFYLEQGMPGKKFRYAAIVKWIYQSQE